MALSNIDITADYQGIRNRILKYVENPFLIRDTAAGNGWDLVHDDGFGGLTFGYGFFLEAVENTGSVIFEALTYAYGPTPTADQTAAIELLRDWRDGTAVTLTDINNNAVTVTLTETDIRNGIAGIDTLTRLAASRDRR